MRDIIRTFVMENFGPYSDILMPTIFIAFFIGTTIFLTLSDRRSIRQVWVTFFFISLVIVNLVGIPALPLIDMHKVAGTPDEKFQTEEVKIADEHGEEIRYDMRAVPPSTHAARGPHTEIDDDMPKEKQIKWAKFMIENAEEYREDILKGDSTLSSFAQPPHHLNSIKWEKENVENMGEFDTVRIYQHKIIYEGGSSDIQSHEINLILEINTTDNSVKIW